MLGGAPNNASKLFGVLKLYQPLLLQIVVVFLGLDVFRCRVSVEK